MKKITIILTVLVSLAVLSCKDNAAAKVKSSNLETAKARDAKMNMGMPIIAFDKKAYDFGTINEGDKIDGAFTIYNKGKADLVITGARASCGCTVPSWPKEAIKPGDSAKLNFVFNSRGKRGKQNKSITLRTNTENVNEIIRVTGNVTPKPKTKSMLKRDKKLNAIKVKPY
ncbi:DUF1573 domain-containing protein [Lutibacter sp.]|uniref:DUF1573 domain-containing protein n=1 Tax=Lutibacter sp. TaxID=1925666 RepID=UPI0025B8F000|nr:DUF1573 domain-containing protein [Lutibacter sp.]MCF6181492.1 DUF1573 domain-containing protein [Lutibacter sp.]